MKTRNRIGPRTEPWGTPEVTKPIPIPHSQYLKKIKDLLKILLCRRIARELMLSVTL